MIPLCTLVHTARGPTPRNHPPMPSLRYINRKPMNTLAVLSFIAPALGGGVVEGELMEVAQDAEAWNPRLCTLGVEAEVPTAVGLVRTCVCNRVLTTSTPVTRSISIQKEKCKQEVDSLPNGHVIVPAKPPAIAPVAISSPIPISFPLPTYSFANFWNCS